MKVNEDAERGAIVEGKPNPISTVRRDVTPTPEPQPEQHQKSSLEIAQRRASEAAGCGTLRLDERRLTREAANTRALIAIAEELRALRLAMAG